MGKLKPLPVLTVVTGVIALGLAILNLGAPLVFAVVSVAIAILSLHDRS